jgi:hypothetical protein
VDPEAAAAAGAGAPGAEGGDAPKTEKKVEGDVVDADFEVVDEDDKKKD